MGEHVLASMSVEVGGVSLILNCISGMAEIHGRWEKIVGNFIFVTRYILYFVDRKTLRSYF